MKNGWTGGQYSMFRVLFGAYLFVHFIQLAPWAGEVFSSSGVLPEGSASPILHFFPNVLALWDSPVFVAVFVAVGAGLGLCFAAGLHDRLAAVGAWYVWACLLGRNPLISNPSIPFVGWLLLAHVCLPRPRFGSWIGSGQIRGDAPWRMSPAMFGAAWVLMALGYSYSGLSKLGSPSWQDGTALLDMVANPLGRSGPVQALLIGLPPVFLKLAAWGALALELLFAPLALVRRLRPWLWALLLAMHLLLLLMVDFADLSLGMVVLHGFTFDPSWIRPRVRGAPGTIFFDGGCGFCHGFVRFVLSEEPGGEGFRFAPLTSGDTIVVQTGDGQWLTRSTAVLYILGRLGGFWRILGAAGRIIPTGLRDSLYVSFARIRRRLFSRPEQACPRIPEGLRSRFQKS